MTPCFRFVNGVERGKWYSSVIKILKENGIEVDSSTRGIIDNDSIKMRAWIGFYNLVQNIRAKI